MTTRAERLIERYLGEDSYGAILEKLRLVVNGSKYEVILTAKMSSGAGRPFYEEDEVLYSTSDGAAALAYIQTFIRNPTPTKLIADRAALVRRMPSIEKFIAPSAWRKLKITGVALPPSSYL